MENPDKFICFDAEMTDRGELLELSIYNGAGEEVYHHYFKPFSQKRWRTDIHHITPEMVKDEPFFSACRRDIQRIVDYADFVIGFAIDNDIRSLTGEGVKGLDKKRVVEIRDWYWLCIGNERGVDINGGPGLQVCAPELGVDFGEKAAHSASGDTEVTLKCFMELVGLFRSRFMADEDDAELRSVIDRFEQEYAVARCEFRRRKAAGALYLLRHENGSFKIGRTPASGEKLINLASVEVADRYKAEYEIRQKFSKRMAATQGYYKLRDADIEWFKAYANEFEEEESEFYKKVLKMNRLGMLS